MIKTKMRSQYTFINIDYRSRLIIYFIQHIRTTTCNCSVVYLIFSLSSAHVIGESSSKKYIKMLNENENIIKKHFCQLNVLCFAGYNQQEEQEDNERDRLIIDLLYNQF